MVPNSLGPAELLLHYGTDEQRDHYLPRLARGEEIPCFALTGPEAGSDAAATAERGRRVPRQMATAARVARHAPLLAQALHHARAGRDADRPRVPAARSRPSARRASRRARTSPARSMPGRDLPGHRDRRAPRSDRRAVPERADDAATACSFRSTAIIGGRDGAGQGWRMLMESLAAGRAISLPSRGRRGGRSSRRAWSSAYATGARAVRHADRALRGRRGAARAHRRAHLR